MSDSTVTTGTANTNTLEARLVVAPPVRPTNALFRVEVDGLLGFTLIPLTDLARDLANAWLAGEKRFEGLSLPGSHDYGQSFRLDRLSITIKPGNLLTNGGDPFYTGQSISNEERTVALAAIAGYREANRANRITVEALEKASRKPRKRARR